MKLFFAAIVFLMGFSGQAQHPDLEEVRRLYKEAASSETAAEELEALLKPYGEEEPVLLAYKASGIMLLGKYVGSPFSKMKFFKEGRELLQRAVAAAPKAVEIRFLRFAVQSKIPGFLGYKDHLEEDKALLLKEVHSLKDGNLKELILPFLERSDSLTENEKEQIKSPNPQL